MRIVLLDLLRVIAITLLLVSHVGAVFNHPVGSYFGIDHFYYVTLGGVAVTIFLLLSGIVLELSYGEKNYKYFEFVLSRILRIYPVYYMCLLFGIMLFIMKGIITSTSLMPYDNVVEIICGITGGHAFIGAWGGPLLDTSWFIGLIMVMYLLFPLISQNKRPHHVAVFLLMVSVSSRIILGNYQIFPMRPLDWFPLCRIFEFGFGVYLAKVVKHNFWKCLNKYTKAGGVLGMVGELSFPLFLIHPPLLWILKRGNNNYLSVFIFLLVSLLVSWVIVIIDKKINRKKMSEMLNVFIKRISLACTK